MSRIGFDVGGTNIKIGLLNDDMDLLSKKLTAFPKELGYQNIINAMSEAAAEMLSENGMNAADVKSLGIAVAGEVDVVNGIVVKAHNLLFYDVPIKDEMGKHFAGVPVSVINDANAAALAEFKKGALKGYDNSLLLTIGTGIGGGVILGGKLFNGGMGHGTELGHITLSMDGPLCTCGNRGCAEALCSATWLANQSGTDAKAVIDGAKKGEPAPLKIFNEYIENLSTAIASLTVIFDPEIIALGGGVSLAGDFLFNALRDKVERKSFFKYPYKIVPAELGNDAGMIGAALCYSAV